MKIPRHAHGLQLGLMLLVPDLMHAVLCIAPLSARDCLRVAALQKAVKFYADCADAPEHNAMLGMHTASRELIGWLMTAAYMNDFGAFLAVLPTQAVTRWERASHHLQWSNGQQNSHICTKQMQMRGRLQHLILLASS